MILSRKVWERGGEGNSYSSDRCNLYCFTIRWLYVPVNPERELETGCGVLITDLMGVRLLVDAAASAGRSRFYVGINSYF